MRCLTLASLFEKNDYNCHFICRPLEGDMLDYINRQGHSTHALQAQGGKSEWHWKEDAMKCLNLVEEIKPRWFVVDHYLLGQQWEDNLKQLANNIFVIDDLGRSHNCEVLLDQNYPNPAHLGYLKENNNIEDIMLGPMYALVRPEFSDVRDKAMSRREGELSKILVCFGGSDFNNETCKVLDALEDTHRDNWEIDVVVGDSNPHIATVRTKVAQMDFVKLHIQTNQMAELMAFADLSITAGGSMTWERYCVGLPGLVTSVSDDQYRISSWLRGSESQIFMGKSSELSSSDYTRVLNSLTSSRLTKMSITAARICDGEGTKRVFSRLH